MSNTFVYAICGDEHAHRVNQSLRFLKRFSRNDILIITTRCTASIAHDQVMRVRSPDHLDDHQAAILLKTNLHRLIGEPLGRCCYLDSDVIAVNGAVDSVFSYRSDPVCFAADHTTLRPFSRYAVNCGCVTGACDHLRDAISRKFNVEVLQEDWQHWNGGVFVFDAGAFEFLDTWHAYTRAIMDDPMWRTRDQGTLIAAAWHHGLQDQAPLPRIFNCIVDKSSLSSSGSDYQAEVGYSLKPCANLPNPNFLHFISGGIEVSGWKIWDDVEDLLRRRRWAFPSFSPSARL